MNAWGMLGHEHEGEHTGEGAYPALLQYHCDLATFALPLLAGSVYQSSPGRVQARTSTSKGPGFLDHSLGPWHLAVPAHTASHEAAGSRFWPRAPRRVLISLRLPGPAAQGDCLTGSADMLGAGWVGAWQGMPY